MKIGTIINNHWASEGNPTKYFVYMGIKGNFATGFYLDGSQLKGLKLYKSDFKKREVFEEVGYCEAFDVMKNDLKKVAG